MQPMTTRKLLGGQRDGACSSRWSVMDGGVGQVALESNCRPHRDTYKRPVASHMERTLFDSPAFM